jgi:penicillin-binding protein 1A
MGEVGSEAVIKTARDLGVAAPLPQGDPSLALGTSGMTLLELTAAYAGVAGERNPVAPTAFKAADEDWFGWLLNRRRSLSGAQREAMEEMLRGAVERGTGRAARLGVPAYGKTGTTQDHRDALFVGFAGDLVVGVWVGNDDNTPLKGITGGGAPARIWRDFMRVALGERAAPPRRARPDPRGPVEPLDVPDPTDIPPGEVGPIRLEEGEAVLSTEIGGRPLDVRIGEDGVRVDDGRSADQVARDREAWQRVQEQARQSLREARERAEEAQRRFEDEARR